jgi:DNA-binding CsgD family transcriptional regulator
MTDELDAFSDVVGCIYQAALDSMPWDEAMVRFVNAYAPPHWDVSFLLWEQAPHRGARFVAAANLAPHAREIYASTFAGVHPWSRRLAPSPIGKIVDTDDICPREELMESDLYKHFLSNWEIVRALAAILDHDEERKLAWVIPGPDNYDISGLRRGMQLMAPHIQRAVRISRRIAEADLRAGAAEASLEMSTAGILALRADMSLVNSNARVETYIRDGTGRVVDGRWRFSNPAANAELDRLCAAPAPASTAFNVTNHDGVEHAVLAVRIAPQSALALDGYVEGASLLVTIGPRSKAPTIPVDHLAAWYNLTPSEAHLAASLADGETVREFAIRRGVTENAVRFLMKGVLRKTGAVDQARLVAALRGLPLALRDGGAVS